MTYASTALVYNGSDDGCLACNQCDGNLLVAKLVQVIAGGVGTHHLRREGDDVVRRCRSLAAGAQADGVESGVASAEGGTSGDFGGGTRESRANGGAARVAARWLLGLLGLWVGARRGGFR